MEATAADGSASHDGTAGATPGSRTAERGRERIGARLAAARAEAGIELSDIARDTRVPLRHLRAIEADTHDELPALPYAAGFVKSFARAVGMDGDEAAARFRAETSKQPHVPAATPLEPLDERRLPPRGLVALSVAALVLLLGGLGAYGAGWFDAPVPAATEAALAPAAMPAPQVVAPALTPPDPTTVPPGDATAATTALADGGAPNTPVAVPAEPAAVPAAAPTATGSGVSIVADDDAWVRITHIDPATGRVASLKTGVLAKGERYDVPPGESGARLWTGRAGALRISVAGRAVPPLGGPVETVKNVSLDATALLARTAPPAVAVTPGVAPR